MSIEPKQIPLKCHVDDRGFLWQIYGNYEDFPQVKRIYVVGNFSKGTIRGFHKHMVEWKCYFVANGAAKFVMLDENERISAYTLSTRDPSVLIVPPTFSHGWVSLEDNTLLIGLSNRSLEESKQDDFRADPLKYGKDVWEVKMR